MRSFIDYYGILAIPMALLFSEMWHFKKQWKYVVYGIVFLLVMHNNFFLEKYRRGALHYDSMTKEAFWYSFWQTRPHDKYWDLLKVPDYEKALEGTDAVIDEDKE